MSFSAVTCLTYTGTTPLGGILNLYSNVDSFTTPFQTNVNLSAITGNQCPYYIGNVPDFTTQIRIYDIDTGCSCDIPIQSNDLCITCDLDFNIYSASTVGRLVAGNLTGSCGTNITDYRIFWYETGNTTTPAYISGKGNEYAPYSFTHPLTGSSAIFAQAGTYVPVIDKIKLSGLTFSQTGGTGNIPAELECFTSTTVTVNAFRCDNGTSNDPNYEHQVSFLGAAAGVTPQSLEATFLFTGITNYFAWKFRGFAVDDRLRLSYIGSAYSEELLIEDITIGSNLASSDFSLNKLPKSASTQPNAYLKKVTCLTGLTKTPGDSLRMEVIPNTINPQTNWDFYFTCLDSFSQDNCILNNSPYKISASTITSTLAQCNVNKIRFKIVGCNGNENSDFSKYIAPKETIITNTTNYYTNSFYSFDDNILDLEFELYLNSLQSESAFLYGVAGGNVCAPSSTGTISFKKYVSGGTMGVIDIVFTDNTDFMAYYNSYVRAITGTTTKSGICFTSSGPLSGTPNNPTDIKYYRYFRLNVPTTTGNIVCGSDGFTQKQYALHTSSVVTTGITGSDYTLRFTMPTIYDGLTHDPNCNIKSNLSLFIRDINNSSTGTTNNFTGTTTISSRYIDPVDCIIGMCSGTTSYITTYRTGTLYVPNYINETIVYSGSPPTMVDSLSGKTFNFDPADFTFFSNAPRNAGYFAKTNYYYTVKLNNPSDYRDFEIYSKPITGATVGSEVLIYGYTGSTGQSFQYQPSYFI